MIVLSVLASCHKSTDMPGQQPTLTPLPIGPFLYVGGGTVSNQGIYWKSQLNHPVPVADTLKNANVITSMVGAPGGLYFAAQTGGYYKDSSFVLLPAASSIRYLAVSGSTVYAAGNDQLANLAYWIGTTENNLDNTFDRSRFPYQDASTFGLSGMTASGGNVYITGYLAFQNYPYPYSPDSAISGNFAMFWTDGSLQTYGPGVSLSVVYQSTAGVALAGNDIYVAGRYPDTTYAGGYWKNGSWNPIANGTFLPSAIAANGNSIYMTGNYWSRGTYTQGAAYWVDGKLVPLNGAYALAITFFQSDIYILGVDNNSNVVVWKNGEVFETIGPSSDLIVTSIAIH
jgi:hypothetical protein